MSGIPFVKAFDPDHGRPVGLSALVTRIVCNNPGPYTYTGSGTYLVGNDRSLAIIDPGPQDADHLASLLQAIGQRHVSHILVTHTHRDHCGGAMALRQATGAPVLAHGPHPTSPDEAPPALDEGGDFSFQPDRHLADGEKVDGDGWQLQAIHTPGHISNHLCFALPQESALFTGDHIMGWATTVVAPPDGNMAQYMSSLDRLLHRDDRVYYPTHGAPVHDPHGFVRAVKDHRLKRDETILAAVDERGKALMDIVAEVYHDVDRSLHLAAALNVQAHLERHVQAGRVRIRGEAFPALTYELAGTA